MSRHCRFSPGSARRRALPASTAPSHITKAPTCAAAACFLLALASRYGLLGFRQGRGGIQGCVLAQAQVCLVAPQAVLWAQARPPRTCLRAHCHLVGTQKVRASLPLRSFALKVCVCVPYCTPSMTPHAAARWSTQGSSESRSEMHWGRTQPTSARKRKQQGELARIPARHKTKGSAHDRRGQKGPANGNTVPEAPLIYPWGSRHLASGLDLPLGLP